MFLVDAHCDTITSIMRKNEELFKNNSDIDIEKLKSFDNVAQFFAIFLRDNLVENAFVNTVSAIEFFNQQLDKNKKYISLAKSYKDIISDVENKKISGILSLEGGEALEGSIENLYYFYEKGIRSICITWNRKNQLADGIGIESGLGLTSFGKEVIKEMNKLGMIIDVSHLSVQGFWDVCEISSKPFIASHSNCFEICKHKRNLNKEQILAMAEKECVIGINLYNLFLEDSLNSDIYSILKHIDYLLNLVDENIIGLGADFDGMDDPAKGFKDIRDYKILYQELEKQYGKIIADKIFGENFLRIIKEIM